MIVITLGLIRKDARDDIIHDLKRFAKRVGVVNLRDIRQYLGPRFGLTPDEIATILRQAVR
ncbi:MAG: hypothetical protein KAW09_04420, partial [Thermoplasmata archaeon]|nr:hypothetical protein [Thermoplasmata archaeon]